MLGRSKRLLEKPVQRRTGRTSLLGGFVSIFYLTENFRFADHHRIKAANDVHQMTDAIIATPFVEMRVHRVGQFVKLVEKTSNTGQRLLWVESEPVDFDAVAGGDDGRLFQRRRAEQLARCLAEQLLGESNSLAHFHRRAAMT